MHYGLTSFFLLLSYSYSTSISNFYYFISEIDGNVNVIPYRKINSSISNITGEQLSSSDLLFGLLVHVADNFGYDSACDLPLFDKNGKDLPKNTSWIALISHGGCLFSKKAKNVFQFGAKGIVVYGNRTISDLERIKATSKKHMKINIVSLNNWQGEELKLLLKALNNIYVYIFISSDAVYKQINLHSASILFSFVVLLIAIPLFILSCHYSARNYNERYKISQQEISRDKLKALSQVPTHNVKSVETDEGTCAICIEPYKINDVTRNLPCNHKYHKNCLDPWIIEKRTCPLCKMDVMKFYGFVFTGSQESIIQLEDSFNEADSDSEINQVMERVEVEINANETT